MSNCLVTTLKETVSDANLRKIGEAVFHLVSNGVVSLNMNTSQTVTLTIEGNGYFSDSSGTSNLGKTKTFESQPFRISVYVKVSGECDFIVSNKYAITALQHATALLAPSEQLYAMTAIKYLVCNVDGTLEFVTNLPAIEELDCRGEFGDTKTLGDISYCSKLGDNISSFSVADCSKLTGDIEIFSDKPSLTSLLVQNTKIGGNLSSLSGMTNLTRISIQSSNVSGNLSGISALTGLTILTIHNTGVEGDISNLSGMTGMQTLTAENTNISGNLSAFSGMTGLKTLRINNTDITGDTSSLANCTQLTTFTYTNTAITGTWPLV